MGNQLLRYHRNIFFPNTFEEDVKSFLEEINKNNWRFGFHSIRKLLQVNKDISNTILKKIYRYRIQIEDIFEVYYISGGGISRVCMRISLTDQDDLILVVDKEKVIVTMYINSKTDKHDSLDTSEYVKE